MRTVITVFPFPANRGFPASVSIVSPCSGMTGFPASPIMNFSLSHSFAFFPVFCW